MGCYIHSFVEIRKNETWEYFNEDVFYEGKEPFESRNYGVFAFLANVRNYSAIKPLSHPRGLPLDISNDVQSERADWDGDGHSDSWFLVFELAQVDYDKIIEDRRYTKQVGPNFFYGGATCEVGQGKQMKLREFLGDTFMSDLEILKTLGNPEDVRVVFWFDS